MKEKNQKNAFLFLIIAAFTFLLISAGTPVKSFAGNGTDWTTPCGFGNNRGTSYLSSPCSSSYNCCMEAKSPEPAAQPKPVKAVEPAAPKDKLTLHAEYEKLQVFYESVKSQLGKTEASLVKSEEMKTYWQQQSESVNAKWADLQTAHIQLQQKANTDADKLTTIQLELAQLIEQNKHQAQEKWEIVQEKAMLEGQLKQLQSMFASA